MSAQRGKRKNWKPRTIFKRNAIAVLFSGSPLSLELRKHYRTSVPIPFNQGSEVADTRSAKSDAGGHPGIPTTRGGVPSLPEGGVIALRATGRLGAPRRCLRHRGKPGGEALSRQLSTSRERARSNQVSCCRDGILPLRRRFGSEGPQR